MKLQAWGKCDRSENRFHHLAHHCMDVAAVFQRLMNVPAFRTRAQRAMNRQLNPIGLSRLSALVFIHDIGKLHPGFQAKGWSDGLWPQPTRGHVSESFAIVDHASRYGDHPLAESVRQLARWGDAAGPLLLASFSHHGRPLAAESPPPQRDWDSPRVSHYDWRSEAANLASAWRRWFASAFESDDPLPQNNRFVHFFAGLAALADWVGSDERFFCFHPDFDPNYDRIAHEKAAEVLPAIGLDVGNLPRPASPKFINVTGFRDPNPAQTAVGQISMDEQLVVLEAETGSGKTEAALWRFAQLLGAGRVDALYFAVPTRAAARQLHGRVNRAAQRLFGTLAPEAVLAIPGMLKAGEAVGHRLPDWKVLWEDTSGTVPARWAAEHATRFLSAMIAVGTIDQAMLAGLSVKHAHLRGSALSRSLLVVDEVHASDAYMTRVVGSLVDSHLAVGGYAMLMSATLGSRARVRWTRETPPTFDQAVATAYPAVWSGGASVPRRAAAGAMEKHVELASDGMDAPRAAEVALEAAGHGARVLVIRNTVTRAVETWTEIQEQGGADRLLQVAGGPAVHHGRFAAEDRELLDSAVEAVLTTKPDRTSQGAIVVGTQTLEQSLDIDADFLITDLCPIDVLLQRIGRLHRHRLRRPDGFGDARCVVLSPELGLDRLTKPVSFDNGLGGWLDNGVLHGIYRDLAVLELTRRLVEERPCWTIPEMNRELVEGATHPERVAELIADKGDAWEAYDRRYRGGITAEGAFASLQLLDRDSPYDETRFPSDDERIMTRLGEEGVVLRLDPPPIGAFGEKITRLALPARWSRGIEDDDLDEIATSGVAEGLVFTLKNRSFTYSRAGLRRSEG